MRTKYMRPQWSMIASHPLRHTPDHMLAHEPGVRPYKFLFSGCDARHPTIAGLFLLIVHEKPKGCFFVWKNAQNDLLLSPMFSDNSLCFLYGAVEFAFFVDDCIVVDIGVAKPFFSIFHAFFEVFFGHVRIAAANAGF